MVEALPSIEDKELLFSVLDTLDNETKQILEMRYIQGFTQSATAEALCISIDKVKNTVRYVKLKLEKMSEQDLIRQTVY